MVYPKCLAAHAAAGKEKYAQNLNPKFTIALYTPSVGALAPKQKKNDGPLHTMLYSQW